jgi:5-formyltetrahydrofolate cyclo-ligase
MTDNQVRERNRIRRLLLAERDRMPQATRNAGSERIVASLVSLPLFSEKQVFFIYCHYRSEVTTSTLLAHCLAQGKIVTVPMSRPEEAQMFAVAITDPIHDLAPGFKRIPEPLPSLVEDRIQLPTTIEVAVIPGVVFDQSGFRLGYGMGFYDRFLALAPQAIRIGLAFSCQMVDQIPIQDHDVPMDILVTEQGVLSWPGRRRAPDCGL